MKSYLTFWLITLSVLVNAQQQFRERTFVVFNTTDSIYQCKSGGKLKTVKHNEKISLVRAGFSLKKNNSLITDSIIHYKTDTTDKKTYSAFKIRVTSPRSKIRRRLGFKEKFYGEVKQEEVKLIFYPWPFKLKTTNSGSLNKILDSNEFVIEIPKRTVISMHYRSLQYGALTLPIKVYLASQVSPVNNYAFDANISFYIGRKWGSNKYYSLPNEKEPQSYTKGFSVNYFLGLCKTEIDSSNTSPEFNKKYTLPTVTSGFAFGMHYKKAGIYIATGIDAPIGPGAYRWHFAYQPWLGFALGLALE